MKDTLVQVRSCCTYISTWNRACNNIEHGETSLDADSKVGRAAVGAFSLVGRGSGPSLSLLLGPGGTVPTCEELEGEGQGRSDLLHLHPLIDGWRRGEG